MSSVNSRRDAVPASVRTLDDLLNRRIATAPDSASVDQWLHVKADVKRRLVGLPLKCVEYEARKAIEALDTAALRLAMRASA